MIRIAVCDDEQKYLNTACAMLASYAEDRTEELAAEAFGTSSELLDAIEGGVRHDIYLLDIYMPGVSGMSVAAELRSRGIRSPIIFLTSSTDHAVEAFGVDATHYLLKPYAQQSFFAAMDKAMQNLPAHAEENIVLKTGSEYQNIAVSELMYCESAGNYQQLLMKSGKQLPVRMTAAELYELLSAFNQFYRCGRAYILNLDYVKKVTGDAVILKNNTVLPLPHSAVAGLRAAFFNHFN